MSFAPTSVLVLTFIIFKRPLIRNKMLNVLRMIIDVKLIIFFFALYSWFIPKPASIVVDVTDGAGVYPFILSEKDLKFIF